MSEVGIDAEGSAVGTPDAPMGVLGPGTFRGNSSIARCFRKAQISEESIAGRRGTIFQGSVCGYEELK